MVVPLGDREDIEPARTDRFVLGQPGQSFARAIEHEDRPVLVESADKTSSPSITFARPPVSWRTRHEPLRREGREEETSHV
jgi:hypothetical protein